MGLWSGQAGGGGGAREAGAPEGAAVRRLWGGAVCEGRA